MKEKRRSRLLVFLLIAVLFVAAAVPVLAVMAEKTISVFTGVSILVDGKELLPCDVNGNPTDAFIYEGTVYVPLRSVGEALGAGVSWNGRDKVASLNSSGAGDRQEDRVALYDAGSGPIVYTCGPMTLSSEFCTVDLDGFSILDSEVAFCDPNYIEKVRLYDMDVVLTGTVTDSVRGYLLCYAGCYDKDGVLIRTEKIYQSIKENELFRIKCNINVPADTARIVVTADRPL